MHGVECRRKVGKVRKRIGLRRKVERKREGRRKASGTKGIESAVKHSSIAYLRILSSWRR